MNLRMGSGNASFKCKIKIHSFDQKYQILCNLGNEDILKKTEQKSGVLYSMMFRSGEVLLSIAFVNKVLMILLWTREEHF